MLAQVRQRVHLLGPVTYPLRCETGAVRAREQRTAIELRRHLEATARCSTHWHW